MHHDATLLGDEANNRLRRHRLTAFRHQRGDIIESNHQHAACMAEGFCRLRQAALLCSAGRCSVVDNCLLQLAAGQLTVADGREHIVNTGIIKRMSNMLKRNAGATRALHFFFQRCAARGNRMAEFLMMKPLPDLTQRSMASQIT